MDPQAIPVIETENLILRGPIDADIDVWAGFVTDPEFVRYVPTSRIVRTPRERAERVIGNYQRRWDGEPLSAMGWAITRRADGQLVGLCGIEVVAGTNEGEIDYYIGKPYWGQGYAGEAAAAATRYALEHTSFDRIVAYVVPQNDPSVRVVRRLGFTYENDVNYLELAGDPNMILDPPIVATYALSRFR